MQKDILEQISLAIREGKAKQTKNLIKQAIEEEISQEDIVNKGLIHAMDELSANFSQDTTFIPQLMLASRAMNVATAVLEDYFTQKRDYIGCVVTATVKGDLHDIGLNLVSMMFRNMGFLVYNMGCDVSADRLIKKAEEVRADIICLSTLLTTTMPQLQVVVKLLENRRIRDKYIVMIGGAPVTQRYADRIGADIYTANAMEAATKAKELMLRRKAMKEEQ